MSSLPRRQQQKIGNCFDLTGQMQSIGEMRNLKVLEMGDGTFDLGCRALKEIRKGDWHGSRTRLVWNHSRSKSGIVSLTTTRDCTELGVSLLISLYLGRWVQNISTSLLSSGTLNQMVKT